MYIVQCTCELKLSVSLNKVLEGQSKALVPFFE